MIFYIIDNFLRLTFNYLVTLTKSDFSQIKEIVKDEIRPVKKDLKKVDKKLDITISLFDKDYLNLKKRVEKVENKLGIPAPLF